MNKQVKKPTPIKRRINKKLKQFEVQQVKEALRKPFKNNGIPIHKEASGEGMEKGLADK